MTMFESDTQKVIRTFNWELLVVTCMIFSIGLLTLFSATKGPGNTEILMKKQVLAFLIGSVIGLVLFFIDSQILERFAYVLYSLSLGLLGWVLLLGRIGGGAKSWISFGFFDFQPSEFSKLAVVLLLAHYFANDRVGGPYSLRRLIRPFLLVSPTLLLVALQPDAGTAGIIFLVAASIVLFLGVQWRSLMIVAAISMAVIPFAYFNLLKDYQQRRVLTFLDPGSDPRGSGYNALQSKIAVGSGRFIGKGYLKGTQAHLNFIPEQHTDFIFSVLAEEWGLVGAFLLILLYFLYCHFALRTAARARDKFQILVVVGLTSLMFWHVMINIGMVIGILPIVGVTLPFMSYGGTSLLTFLMSVALLLNMSRKKYIF